MTKARIIADYAGTGATSDLATQAELNAVSTVANAALPKAGGAMTGAITTNSTFDGIDIAVRDALHAPKASPTFTGNFTSVGIDDNADATAMTIDASENVLMGVGDLTITGAGKGIGFGSEIMDDYEEFTWNPALRSGSYNHFTISYNTQGIKIGRLVHMTIYGTMTATASGGVDSVYASATLPYVAGSTNPAITLGVGTGGHAYGFFHNTYGNALGAGAYMPSHSNGTVIKFSMNITYFTDS